MSDEAVVAIARIPLARSTGRMLAVPALLLLAAAVAAGAGLLLLEGWPRFALLGAAGLVAVLAVYIGLVIFSVRLDVEVSTLRLRRIGADQRFTLVRGAVTRVPLTGEGAARLQPRLGALAWGVGPARLRGDERIHLVRMAPTESVILVPTDAGRVAIAPASEEQLIAALGAAARVQQRLDQVAARARSVPLERLVEEAPRAVAPPPREPEAGRVLTGIERVLLEERLAAERAAALAAAEAERRRAAEAAALAAEEAARAAATIQAQAPAAGARPRRAVSRPGWARLPRPRIALPSAGRLPRQRLVQYLVAAAPLLLATGLWAAATLAGRLELPESQARLAALSLALAGPAAALGALAARAWFPRLLGLVAVSSACALVLVGRALFN